MQTTLEAAAAKAAPRRFTAAPTTLFGEITAIFAQAAKSPEHSLTQHEKALAALSDAIAAVIELPGSGEIVETLEMAETALMGWSAPSDEERDEWAADAADGWGFEDRREATV